MKRNNSHWRSANFRAAKHNSQKHKMSCGKTCLEIQRYSRWAASFNSGNFIRCDFQTERWLPLELLTMTDKWNRGSYFEGPLGTKWWPDFRLATKSAGWSKLNEFPLGSYFLCYLSPLPVCKGQVMTACRCCKPSGITTKCQKHKTCHFSLKQYYIV